MEKLPREKSVTPQVPIAVLRDPSGRRKLDEGALCSLLINADHAYISARFLMWADNRMLSLAFFLAALAAELYLKAFLVSRLSAVPDRLAAGTSGHDLDQLANCAAETEDSDSMFNDPRIRETLRRLTRMQQAGRYPRSGYTRPGTEIGAFCNWLDEFACRVRALVPYPELCRDDIDALREFTPDASVFGEYESIGRSALRELFFAQNRAFDGWYFTGDGRRLKIDRSPWT